MTVSVASEALFQPRFHAYSAIAEPSSWATLPNENASRPLAPKRFGPIWSVPMHAATVSLPALIAVWTTGAAEVDVARRHDDVGALARRASRHTPSRSPPCCPGVLHVMSRSFVALVLFTASMRAFAVASAGPSNGGHRPDTVVRPADRDRLGLLRCSRPAADDGDRGNRDGDECQRRSSVRSSSLPSC